MYDVSKKNVSFTKSKKCNLSFYIKIWTYKIYNHIHVIKLKRFDRITIDRVKLKFLSFECSQGKTRKYVHMFSLFLGILAELFFLYCFYSEEFSRK